MRRYEVYSRYRLRSDGLSTVESLGLAIMICGKTALACSNNDENDAEEEEDMKMDKDEDEGGAW